MCKSIYANGRLSVYKKAGRRYNLPFGAPLKSRGENNGLVYETEGKDSLKFSIVDRWLERNLREVRSARLRVKMAYLDYVFFCRSNRYPAVTIQGFSQSLFMIQGVKWPSSSKKKNVSWLVASQPYT